MATEAMLVSKIDGSEQLEQIISMSNRTYALVSRAIELLEMLEETSEEERG